MSLLGKSLILLGIILILAGVLLVSGNKLSRIGRLPGDIHIRKKNFTFSFPLTTCILLSLILSFILWTVTRRF